jgi:glycosyltransferase involved in cell wall biosynthesis
MFGGVERMLETLAPATAGREPIESSYALCFEGRVSQSLRSAGAHVQHLGEVHARRLHEVRRARGALRTALDLCQPDVAFVHSAWSQAIFGPVVLESGLPLARWLHAPQPGPRWLEYWSRRARPALVLCNSHYTRQRIGNRFDNSTVLVQYPPATARRSDPSAREGIRTALGTAPDAVVFVLAARLEAGKGHTTLLDALGQLPPDGWEAWIVGGVQAPGEQEHLGRLRKQTDDSAISNAVRFLGQRDDVPALLAAADVYCQPNLAPDSFGLSFVEALAAGLPVVTTGIGASPEIIDDTCGVLIEPASVPALAAALRGLLDHRDERRRMSAAARTRAARFCDLSRSLASLADAIRGASRACTA